jgi:branched-chain amino acid transport system permease protein
MTVKKALLTLARIPSSSSAIWYGLAAMAVVTFVFTATQSSFTLFVFNSVLLACIGAASLNLLMGTAGQVSIGNAALLGAGAFVSYWLLQAGLAFPLNVIVAGPICGAAGLLIALPALRLRGLHLALATLAAHFIFIFIATRYQGGSVGLSVEPLFISRGLDGGQQAIAWVFFGVTALILVTISRLARGRTGRAWRMIRDHQEAAPGLGIPVVRYKLVVFALSSIAIGVQGGLTLHFLGYLTVDSFTLHLAIQYIAMVLIGGMDSLAGSVIGAAAVVSLPHILPTVLSKVLGSSIDSTKTPAVSLIAYGFLIIVFVLSSSRGIVGWMSALGNRLTNRSREPAAHGAESSTRDARRAEMSARAVRASEQM